MLPATCEGGSLSRWCAAGTRRRGIIYSHSRRRVSFSFCFVLGEQRMVLEGVMGGGGGGAYRQLPRVGVWI